MKFKRTFNILLALLLFFGSVLSPPVMAQLPRGIARTKRIRVQANPTYEFIDKSGKRAVPYLYHRARSFSEGLAPVLLGEEWGYIDKDGNLIIGARFKLARDFSEGLAAVKVKDKWGYCNRKGEIVIKPRYASCGDFKNGIAVVYVGRGSKDFPKEADTKNIKTSKKVLSGKNISQTRRALLAIIKSRKAGFIDREGNYLVKPAYTSASQFEGDLALVRDGDSYYFIDKKGVVKLKPECTRAKSFSDGFAAVKSGEKWGFINEFGKMAIKPQFSNVQDFNNGLAACKVDKLWGFIDKKGKWQIEPQFSSVWSGFTSGAAVCAKDVSPIKDSFGTITKFNSGYIISRRQGASRKFDESTTPLEPGYFSYPDFRFGLVGRKGDILVPFKYGEIGELQEGLRACEIDGRFGYIDNIGNVAIKPRYKAAQAFSDGRAMVKHGICISRNMVRAQTLLKHSVPALVNDPELIRKDIEVAAGVIKLDENNAQAYRDKGYLHCCLKEFEASLPDFTKVIEICPISTEGYYWRGHSYLQLKKYEKAAKDFSRAIALDRKDARFYSGRAQAYLGQDKDKLAFVDVVRAVKYDSKPYYHSLLAEVFKRLGQKERWLMECWLSRRSTNLNPWPAWAESLSELEKEVKECETTLNTIKKKSPTYNQERVLALTQLADSVDKLRRLKYREEKMLELETLFKRSYEYREKALSLAKKNKMNRLIIKMLTNDFANSIAQLASWYNRKERFAESDELTRKALELADETGSEIKKSDYLNDLAKLQMKQEKYKEAEESLKKSLAVSEKSKRTLMKIIRGQTLSIYANLLIKINRDREAEKMLEEANEHLMIGIKLAFLPSPPQAPDDSDSKQYFELGLQCKSMGLVEMARSYMQKAVEVAENDEDRRKAERFVAIYLPSQSVDLATSKTYLTGRTAEVAGDFISAERLYTDLTKSTDKFYWPYVALARIYRENGQLTKAEKNARKALSLNKECVEALIELSKINKERGRTSKGITTINKALQLDPDNQLAKFISDRLQQEKESID